jgi:hypothetical protein
VRRYLIYEKLLVSLGGLCCDLVERDPLSDPAGNMLADGQMRSSEVGTHSNRRDQLGKLEFRFFLGAFETVELGNAFAGRFVTADIEF